MFDFFFHCFLAENKKKKRGGEGQKVSGKTRNATAGKGDRQTSFNRSNCLISGRVTIKYGLTVVDYIIPMKGHFTVKWTPTSMEDLMIVPLC